MRIFAASSLTEVIVEISEEFQRENPGVQIEHNLAGSQELRWQLEHGARAEVFLSADPRQMGLARQGGLLEGEPMVFATNSLVLLGAAGTQTGEIEGLGEGGVTVDGVEGLAAFKALAEPGTTLAMALPEVPAGAYARQALLSLEELLGEEGEGYAERVLANVVTMETNVRSVAVKVALREVDRGMVYATDARAPFIAENTFHFAVPREAGQRTEYLAAAVSGASEPELAEQFLDFLLSPRGQGILESYGFGPAAGRKARSSQVHDSLDVSLQQSSLLPGFARSLEAPWWVC